MYWTDWGSSPRIERAGMDGTHRMPIVTYEVKWPNGITLDLVRKRVYWVDAKLNEISSCNYDGSGRNVVLYSPDSLRHPFSITTFEDFVYWTDWDKEAVFKANKFTGKDVEAITALHMKLALTVFHAHETIFHKFEPGRTGAGDAGTAFINLGRRQAEMRTVTINCLAVIDTVGLPVRMVDMDGHGMLQLLENAPIISTQIPQTIK
uniref:Uncharacterized protein n=1 Tax=Phlebotomus papatasi TaxID=29031 RepID=A0A1B0DFC9_PHLPP